MAVIMADINTVPGPSALMPAVQLSPRQQRDPMAAGGTADSGDPEQDRLEATELAKAENHCAWPAATWTVPSTTIAMRSRSLAPAGT